MSNNTSLNNIHDADTDSEDESFEYEYVPINPLGQDPDENDILNQAFIQEDEDGGPMDMDELYVPLTLEDLNTDHVDQDEPETDDEGDISFGGKKKAKKAKKRKQRKQRRPRNKFGLK